jgi:hypothetical protein
LEHGVGRPINLLLSVIISILLDAWPFLVGVIFLFQRRSKNSIKAIPKTKDPCQPEDLGHRTPPVISASNESGPEGEGKDREGKR